MNRPLTVLIPCKNERLNLRPCVEAARLVADEVLVADSGSTDGTLDIARDLGCRIIEREWNGYAAFKNWAIPQAQNAWVLIVDADERVTPELAAEIKATLTPTAEDIDGYWISRRNFFLGYEIKQGSWGRDRVIRLIQRDRCRYAPRLVHEEIDIAPSRAGRLTARLDHYTYWTWEQCLAKNNHYAQLDAQQRFEQGCRPSYLRLLFNPPLRFIRDFVLKRGFLDGMPGLQIAMLAAYATFIKQARLWEMCHARQQPDPETITKSEQHAA